MIKSLTRRWLTPFAVAGAVIAVAVVALTLTLPSGSTNSPVRGSAIIPEATTGGGAESPGVVQVPPTQGEAVTIIAHAKAAIAASGDPSNGPAPTTVEWVASTRNYALAASTAAPGQTPAVSNAGLPERKVYVIVLRGHFAPSGTTVTGTTLVDIIDQETGDDLDTMIGDFAPDLGLMGTVYQTDIS